MSILSAPHFHDEAAAFQMVESLIWPNGPVCPHCGENKRVYVLDGVRSKPSKKNPEGVVRHGLKKCAACRKQFTVRVGTLFEDSHLPLHLWLQAFHLLCSSKKGISSHQLHRTLEISYEAAWFLSHRIREAMASGADFGPMGGHGAVIEADETYVGGKSKNVAYGDPAPKKAVVTLVERDGRARSFHVANVTGKTIRKVLDEHADKASVIMTDESPVYPKAGAEFANHHTVNHSANEYVRLGRYVHTNTVEGYYAILKRGIIGTYHSVSEAHLHRYLAEFDFRYSNRSKLGCEDAERTARALAGVKGKRLTYRINSQSAE